MGLIKRLYLLIIVVVVSGYRNITYKSKNIAQGYLDCTARDCCLIRQNLQCDL